MVHHVSQMFRLKIVYLEMRSMSSKIDESFFNSQNYMYTNLIIINLITHTITCIQALFVKTASILLCP